MRIPPCSSPEAQVELKRSHAQKMAAAIPTWKIVRYLQLENKIRAAVRYDIARRIPLVY